MVIIVFWIASLFVFFNSTSTGFAFTRKIIIHDQAGGGISSRTGPLLKNLTYIDSLSFDGITINIPATWQLLAPGNVANYNDIYETWLEPLKGKLHRVTHNFVKVVVRESADPFDDWAQAIKNWVTLARAARDAGLEGVWFDNEGYYEQMWNYPKDVRLLCFLARPRRPQGNFVAEIELKGSEEKGAPTQ